jgi:O-antigen/teichoic acid export membrane protein
MLSGTAQEAYGPDPIAEPGVSSRRRRDLAELVALNTALLVGGRLLVAASGIVAVAAVTRYLGRDAFGELTIALSFIAVFGSLTDLGLWTIAAREIAKRPAEEKRILDTVFSLGLILTALSVCVALLAMVILYGGPGRVDVRLAIVIVGLQLLVTAPSGTAAAYLTAQQRAGPVALAAALAAVSLVAGVLAAVWLDLGIAAVAGAYALAASVNALAPAVAMIRDGVRFRLALDRPLAGQLTRWAVPQAGVLLLSILYFRIDTLILSLLSSNLEVALYGVAYRVVEALAVFPIYFMATLFPEFARVEPRSERLSGLARGALGTLAIFALAVAVPVAGFAHEIVAVVATQGFGDAVPVLQLVAVAIALVFVNAVFFHALVALNRQRQLLNFLLWVLAANVALNFALVPIAGAVGTAIALIASDALALVLAARLFGEVGDVPRLHRPLRLLGATAVLAVAVVALHLLGDLVGAPPLVTVAVGTPLALALYFVSLWTLRAVPAELEALVRRLGRQARTALGAQAT